MVKSVVATGKVEPITKVEIKSKANGIIKALQRRHRSDGQGRRRPRRARQGTAGGARCAAPKPTSWPRAPRSRRPKRRLKKNRVEAEGPDAEFARRAYERAQSLFAQQLIAQSALDDAHSLRSTWPRTASAPRSRSSAVSQAKVAEARAQVAQAKAAADRAAEDVANATIRAPIRGTVLTRDVEIGSPVSSILNLGANATLVMTLGDIDAGLRPRQGRRGRHRPRAAWPAGAHPRRNVQGQDLQRPRHADLADGRGEGQRHQLRGARLDRQPGQGAQGEHDGERRDRARRARRTR